MTPIEVSSESSHQFIQMLEERYQQLAPDYPLHSLRIKAWDRLQNLGIPPHKSEAYRYLSLRSLLAQTYNASSLHPISREEVLRWVAPECTHSFLLFVNGHFQPTLSQMEAIPPRVAVMSMAEAMRTYGTLIQNQWGRAIREEEDPFAVMNTALHTEAAFLYLPPNTAIETPIQILNLIDGERVQRLLLPRLQIFAGASSKATFFSSTHSLSGENYCCSQITDFTLEENAHISHLQTTLEIPAKAWHFDATRALLKRDSRFHSVAVSTGGAGVRQDYRIAFKGEGSEASLNGIALLSEKREVHTHVLVTHEVPSCQSNQKFKSVVSGFARTSFEGKIWVKREAQKTNAFQLNQNLLLSPYAVANTKPNLEIFADDVKASHGATVGQLDPKQLFYLKTRGFSEKAAKNFLIQSFCREIVDLIPISSVRLKALEQAIQTYSE